MLAEANPVIPQEGISLPSEILIQNTPTAAPKAAFSLAPTGYPPLTKAEVRTSLKASTLDGVFAAVFSNITGGVLLSSFLVGLKASPLEIGLLAALPMLANLLQPLGAYWSEKTTSRQRYSFWIYGISRLLWLILAIGVGLASWGKLPTHQLVAWALGISLLSYFLGALGSASWMSWMAALVPSRLRGRYFGRRCSAASLTALVSVPLAGFAVSAWPGGDLQGYGVILALGVVAGLLSIGHQLWMKDVNPQTQRSHQVAQIDAQIDAQIGSSYKSQPILLGQPPSLWQDTNFMVLLAFFSLWMFSVHLSAPFFNIYLLDTLHLNITWVTLYSSLGSGAHLLMMMAWGTVADRLGNRPILISVGILVALTPMLWLGTDAGLVSLWLWLPLLHLLQGATWSAIDLCSQNIQLEIAPTRSQSTYFAIAAAVAGMSGALGTTVGGCLVQFAPAGGLLGLFALSSVLRLAALLPLVFVQEPGSRSLKILLQKYLPHQWRDRPVLSRVG